MKSARASRVRALAARVRGFVRGPQHDDGFDEEIQEHLRMLADRFVAQGTPRAEAELAAAKGLHDNAFKIDLAKRVIVDAFVKLATNKETEK